MTGRRGRIWKYCRFNRRKCTTMCLFYTKNCFLIIIRSSKNGTNKNGKGQYIIKTKVTSEGKVSEIYESVLLILK